MPKAPFFFACPHASDPRRARRVDHKNKLIKFFLTILLVAFSANFAVAASVEGLAGHWPFEEGVGMITKDLSGNENSSQLVNEPTWVPGKFGYGLSFNGVDQYVDIPHSDSLNAVKELTLSAWVFNAMSADSHLREPEFHIIASKGWAPDVGGSWTLAWDKQSNDLSFCVRQESDKDYDCVFVSYDSLTHDWHHVAAVFNSGKVSLYIDGLPAAKPLALGTTNIMGNTENVRIGAVQETKNAYLQNWDGFIDELQIYNRALTDVEIKTLSQNIGIEVTSESTTNEPVQASETGGRSKPGKGNAPVETPVITPNGGEFSGSVSVTLTSATPGASIYYTTDGDKEPDEFSLSYKDPIILTSYTVIRARAFKKNSPTSLVTMAEFKISNQQFDFAISNSGDKATQKGSSAQNQIVASLLTGTSQPVAFSVSGMPSGAHAAFSTASCGPACSSTLTVATSGATPAGTFPLVVTASGGGKSKSTSFNLTVAEAPFDFSLSNAGNQSVTAGAAATNQIDATLGSGSSQSVTFSASGLPAGATASFSSVSCNPTCSTTMTINTTAGTTPGGTSLITVSAAGGGVTQSTTFNLTIDQPTVAEPTISPSGGSYTGSVSVTMATATAGAAIRYTTNGSTPTTSSSLYSGAMTLTNSATVKAAAFMNGYNPSGVASATFIIAQPFAFSLSASNNGSSSVTAGSSIAYLVSANLISGTAQAVTFSASGLPAGATASFSSASCSPTCSSILTISTTAGATPGGTSTINVSAVGGGVSQSANINLTVVQPTVAMPTITPNGGSITGSTAITITTTTAGALIRYTTNGSIPTASSTLYSGAFTLSNSATVKAVAFKTNYNQSTVASASFTITQPFDFFLDVSGNGNKSVTAGLSAGYLINASLVSGSSLAVSFSVSGLPAGASASFSSASCSPTCSSILTISTTAGTTPGGTSAIIVSATGGGVTRTTTFNLTVTLPPSQLLATWQYTGTGQTGFAIERRLGSTGSYAQIATVGSTVMSYTDASVVSGSMYCYRTQAFNATQVSGYSNEACQSAP